MTSCLKTGCFKNKCNENFEWATASTTILAFVFLFAVIYDRNYTQISCKFLLNYSVQSRKETYTEDINRCNMFDIRCSYLPQQSKKANNPVGIYLLKVNNRNTRTRCEICSKLTIKKPERCLVSLLLTLNIFHTLF